MNAVKTLWALLIQRASGRDGPRSEKNKTWRLICRCGLGLLGDPLGWQNIRSSRTEDRRFGLRRLYEAARNISGIRRGRDAVAALAIRHHRSSPSGAADDLLRFHGSAAECVVHHLGQLGCGKCADDGATCNEKSDHGLTTINLVLEKMQFLRAVEDGLPQRSILHAGEDKIILVFCAERHGA